jgi:hypothetical protein
MAAHKRDNFRLFAFRKRRKNLIDGQTPQADNRPSQLLARRIRNDKLGMCRLHERTRDPGCQHSLPYFAYKPTPRDS